MQRDLTPQEATKELRKIASCWWTISYIVNGIGFKGKYPSWRIQGGNGADVYGRTLRSCLAKLKKEGR
jgi:hypothetical protein